MFEHRRQPLVSRRVFVGRLLWSGVAFTGFIGFSLGVGTLGYHLVAGLDWLESLLNASMILTGMGPVDEMVTPAAKVFAIGYALFSGVAFLTSIGVLAAPILHRLFHRFHLESDENAVDDERA
jgi:hypothetical protein